MKNNSMIIVFLTLHFCAYSQKDSAKKLHQIYLQEVIYVKANLFNNKVLFGIYPDRFVANEVLKKYSKKNGAKTNRISYKKIKPGHIEVENGENVFEKFSDLCPNGYKIITEYEYTAIGILRNDTFHDAVWYYIKQKKINKDKATMLISQLASEYAPFLMY